MKNFLRYLAVLLALTCMVGSLSVGAIATSPAEPTYVGLLTASPVLSISSGKATCRDSISIRSGYSVNVKTELQYLSGQKWSQAALWTTSGKNTVLINKERYVTSGYKYRIKETIHVYNAKGTLVESPIKYSAIVTY